MNVKLERTNTKLIYTSYKGALFRANLDSCELYYILVYTACTVPSGALKATITPRLLPGPLDRLSHSGTEPFWHATSAPDPRALNRNGELRIRQDRAPSPHSLSRREEGKIGYAREESVRGRVELPNQQKKKKCA